jgi:hypothetical protein
VGRATDREHLFMHMWAVATLAHVIGNGWQGDLLPTPNVGGVALAAVAVAALAALVSPGRVPLLVPSATIVVSAVVEMPIVGNHWIVAALVSLAYLLWGGRWSGFEPAARLVLLFFYSFAAFAKVNEGFPDPTVSWALYYADQTLAAVGQGPVDPDRTAGHGAPLRGGRYRAGGAAAAHRPAQALGSVLLALFVLFLPDTWSRTATQRLRDLPGWLTAAASGAGLALTLLLVLAALVPPGVLPVTERLAFVVWVPYAATVVVLVLLGPRRTSPLEWRPAALAWLAVALTFVNGLTPWTETKTAFGYTMYSNLEVAQGRTNHELVTATLPLRTDLDRLVAVEVGATTRASTRTPRRGGCSRGRRSPSTCSRTATSRSATATAWSWTAPAAARPPSGGAPTSRRRSGRSPGGGSGCPCGRSTPRALPAAKWPGSPRCSPGPPWCCGPLHGKPALCTADSPCKVGVPVPNVIVPDGGGPPALSGAAAARPPRRPAPATATG